MKLWEDASQLYEKARQHPLVCLIFIIVLLSLIALPPWRVSNFEINNATNEAILENQYRATLAQILGGIAIGIGLYYTWRRIIIAENNLKHAQATLVANQKVAQDNLEVAQEGQITERFTRAVDQLGNEKMEIRLGGIYALERISKESKDDYWPIMEILTAYVRKNSSVETVENEKVTHLSMDIQANESTKREVSEVRKVLLDIDIQTILTVLGKRKKSFNGGKYCGLNLRRTNLQEADLIKAHFEGAAFTKAHLEGAYLWEAHLEGSYLGEAHLEGAKLEGACLEGAYLEGAYLKKANLREANLKGTELNGAYLEGASLVKAHLEGAKLFGAKLEGADLMEVHLEGAYLWEANLKRAYLWEAHLEGANLQGANLQGANLNGAYLERANLREANLKGAYLMEAHLEGANFQEAHLEETVLNGANLQGANNLSLEQLSKAFSLYDAKIDEKLLISLKEKYPALFEKRDYCDHLINYPLR